MPEGEKSCYKDEFSCFIHARRAAHKGRTRPYHCSDCGKWHLTGNSRRKGYKIAR